MTPLPDGGPAAAAGPASNAVAGRDAIVAAVRRARRPAWLVMSLLGALGVAAIFANPTSHGADALAFWSVDPGDPYAYTGDGALAGTGAFRYAPIVAVLLAPLQQLPWPVFLNLWTIAQLAALAAIGRRWALVLVLFPPVFFDLAWGNINIFLAFAVAMSFRWPAAWAVPLLTKVTPGVGLAWYVGRRDWRSLLLVALALACAIVVSLPFVGVDAWAAWLDVLRDSAGQAPVGAFEVPLLPRVLVAFALSVYAGATDRRWLIPLAVTLAMPVLWTIAYAPLIAIVAIARARRAGDGPAPAPRGIDAQPAS